MHRRKIRSTSSRSLSNPSMYDGSVMDRKTRQPLFFECYVCILGRTKLTKDESYSQNKAEVLMNRQYDKRQSHCILFCLEDCIRFEKSKKLGMQPMRNYVKYNCIKHVFIFQEKPDAFMLCIDSGRSDRRTYEAFKCKQPEDVITICEIVFKASKDPECKLRDLIPIKEYTNHSELSKSINHFSTHELNTAPNDAHSSSATGDGSSNALAVRSVFSHYDAPIENTVQRTVNAQQRETPMFAEASIERMPRTLIYETPTRIIPKIESETEEQYLVQQEMDAVMAFHEKLAQNTDDEWEVNVTYLQWDNIRGATINDRGPIYMYVARHLHPVNER